MPTTPPPQQVIDELLGSTTRHTRRVEIYEQDGTTRWTGDDGSLLRDGSISVDYDRDERRAIDLTLDNSDNALVNAPGQFWYDKVIKAYRGVIVREPRRVPSVIIIADGTGTDSRSYAFQAALVSIGFDDIRVNGEASSMLDLAGYDIVVALASGKETLMQEAYAAGMRVFSAGSGTDWLVGLFGSPS